MENQKITNETKPCKRKCIVTNKSLDTNAMIRFVLDPKGEIIPDIDEKLEGRGCWVTGTKSALEIAIKKSLFAKAFKKKVPANANLIPVIEHILKQKCLRLISFSKKAGVLISGFEKVTIALKKNEVYLLLIANDGKENGIKKMLPFTKNDLILIKLFDSIELGQTIGKENTVFVATKKANVTEKLFAECCRFSTFIEKELNCLKDNYNNL